MFLVSEKRKRTPMSMKGLPGTGSKGSFTQLASVADDASGRDLSAPMSRASSSESVRHLSPLFRRAVIPARIMLYWIDQMFRTLPGNGSRGMETLAFSATPGESQASSPLGPLLTPKSEACATGPARERNGRDDPDGSASGIRSEEHTSELQSRL